MIGVGSDIDIGSFVLCTLAVWRLTHLLACEDGPLDLVFKLRRWAGQSVIGSLLDCFYCLSIWMSVPFALALAASWSTRFVTWLALSGGASLLFKISDSRKAQGE
jgi:hypothetical protein